MHTFNTVEMLSWVVPAGLWQKQEQNITCDSRSDMAESALSPLSEVSGVNSAVAYHHVQITDSTIPYPVISLNWKCLQKSIETLYREWK